MKTKLLLLIFILGTSIVKSQVNSAPLMGNYWSINTTTITPLMGPNIITIDTSSILLTKTSDTTFTISGSSIVDTLYYIINNDSTFHSMYGLGFGHFTKDSIYFMFDRGTMPSDWSVSGKGEKIITGIPDQQTPGFSIIIQREKILINTNNPNEYFVTISDINGKILLQKKYYDTSNIDIDQLLTGIYFLNIYSNGRETHKKFLKIN